MKYEDIDRKRELGSVWRHGYAVVSDFMPAFADEPYMSDNTQDYPAAWSSQPFVVKKHPPRPFRTAHIPSDHNTYLVVDPSPLESFKYYDYMRPVALHRLFATLDERDPTEVAAFADKYGLLGGDATLILIPRVPDADWPEKVRATGESLSYWQYQVRAVRDLIASFDLLANTASQSNEDLLERIYAMQSNYPPRDTDRELRGVADCVLELFPDSEYKNHTREVTYSALTWLINMVLETEVIPKVELQPTRTIKFVPKNLLGAIHAHLAHEVLGEYVTPRQCPACGTWFTPIHGRQKYCQDRCRSKAYRSRQNRT
jgi:hypothetical protein